MPSEHSNEAVSTGNKLSLLILVIVCVTMPFVAAVPLSRTALFTYWPGAARNQNDVAWNARNGPNVIFGGPYYGLRRGSYVADFQLKLTGPPSETPPVRVEVVAHSNAGPTTFARDVRLQEIPNSEFATYSCPFDLVTTSVVETRLFSYGKVDGLARVVRVRTANTFTHVDNYIGYIAVTVCALLAYSWMVIATFRQRIFPVRLLLGVHLGFASAVTAVAGSLVNDGQFGQAATLWLMIVLFAGTLLLVLYRSLPPQVFRMIVVADGVASFLALRF